MVKLGRLVSHRILVEKLLVNGYLEDQEEVVLTLIQISRKVNGRK